MDHFFDELHYFTRRGELPDRQFRGLRTLRVVGLSERLNDSSYRRIAEAKQIAEDLPVQVDLNGNRRQIDAGKIDVPRLATGAIRCRLCKDGGRA